jgi:hypothetical protein
MNGWLRDIDRATTEAEILAHTQDYLSLVHPRDLAVLPQELRTIRIERDSDIPVWRERLAKGCAAVHAPPHEVARVHEMVSYLSKAAERLGEIRVPR